MQRILLIGTVVAVVAVAIVAFLLIRHTSPKPSPAEPESRVPEAPAATAISDADDEEFAKKTVSPHGGKEREKPGPQSIIELKKREQGGLERITYKLRNQLVTLNFCETPLKKCVECLRDMTGLTFVISEAIPDADELTVTLRLKSIPLSRALDAICIALGNLDYGIFTHNGAPAVLLSTPDKITRRGIKKPDNLGQAPEMSSVKLKCPGKPCPFRFSEEELLAIREIEEALSKKIRIDQAATKFRELKDIIEKRYEIPIALSETAQRKLEGNPSIQHGCAEMSCWQLFRKIEEGTGLKCVLSPDGVVLVSRVTYIMISQHRDYQSSQEIQIILESRSVTLSFSDTPLMNVISFLQDITGLNIIISAAGAQQAQEESVTLRVKDIPLDHALTMICDEVGLIYEIKESYIVIKYPSEE